MVKENYQICKKCIMDTSDKEIIFDDSGICNHCKRAEQLQNSFPINLTNKEREKELKKIVRTIKISGRNKKYDCIIGVSGGVDSTYLAYIIKELGLRPLAVHLDNGWNSELSVHNIEKCLKTLDIDLETIVLDWEEFKDLQLSFLKSSTPDLEIPTDHAITAVLYTIASRYGVKYIIPGSNFNTESVLPRTWSHGHNDWRYIKSLQQKFGKRKLKTFPHLSLLDYIYHLTIERIRMVKILDYVDYNKKDAVETLKKKLKWVPYGNKHYESIYTRFIQGYILPKKFNYDKRRAHLSSLILSGQMTRQEALKEINKSPYPSKKMENEDKEYVMQKLNITEKEFEDIMKKPPKHFWDYPSYEKTLIYKILITGYNKIKSRFRYLYID